MSRGLDRLLPADYVIDGNSDFKSNFAPKWLKANARVVDIGGGKNPFLTAERKNALGIHVTGVDISAQELERAPVGAYDKIICADIYPRQPAPPIWLVNLLAGAFLLLALRSALVPSSPTARC
ncbi:MAG: hypothetical protein H0T87_11515 [Gammaproteobacteria bacterium]|nr:hypothetical protein [Gammaproteobacteria bacterium]